MSDIRENWNPTVRYDHVAFMPDPLGDEPSLDNAAWRAVSAANHALGALDQAGRQIPEPALLRRPTLRREAQSTSALEGTYAPLADVLEADIGDQRTAELTEVLNYVKVAELAYATLAGGRRLSMGLLLELQHGLVRDTAAETRDAGRIRTVQIAIGGSPATLLTAARFVPPPPGLARESSTRDLVDWINDTPRAGRDHLADLSATGDWSRWVRFFAQGLRDSAEETSSIVKDLLDLQELHRDGCGSRRCAGSPRTSRDH